MRVMTDEQSEILRKLLKLANGDSALVDRAIKEAAQGKPAAVMSDVISIIRREATTDTRQRA